MRKPRQGFNFSIETIFSDLRKNLNHRIHFTVAVCSFFNDGFFSKIINILQASIRQKKYAIAHVTGEVNFLNLLMHTNHVLLTIHDCRFVERKKGLSRRIIQWLYLKAPVKKSSHVIAVSEKTKQDIILYTGCINNKITVIPVAVHAIFKPLPKTFNYKKPVILQIGTAENKNVHLLIKALQNISCSLVIIGEVDEQLSKELIENNIDYTIKYNLSQQELYTEYINCDIVSFISTFEGFGMPIIEANSVERVVITSNISSMPEVAGNAACLVNPYDIESIRNGFQIIINNENYRNQLLLNGRRNKERFDSMHIANSYYNIYKKIADQINAD